MNTTEHYKILLKAYTNLDYGLTQLTSPKPLIPLEIIQDSVIYRFRYCYIPTWVYLKQYIHAKHDLVLANPKKVFQECLKINIIYESEALELKSMMSTKAWL